MKRFLDWFEKDSSTDLVLKAGVAHLWFVTIHPFDDGNGRIARAIADMVLARSERARSAFTACRRKSGRSAMPITKSSKRRKRAISTSRVGSNGFWTVSGARLRMPKSRLKRL